MKHYLPEISWHSRDAIMSVHFAAQKNDQRVYKMATAGVEKLIRVWAVHFGSDELASPLQVDFVATLTHHQSAVNVLRFGPTGELLASGDADGVVAVWELSHISAPDIFAADDQPANKENWQLKRRLRSQTDDISDLAWSADGSLLACCSVDKSVVVYDMEKCLRNSTAAADQRVKTIADHRNITNGVCWDAFGQFLVSMGVDREMHVYDASTPKFGRLLRVSKANIPAVQAGTTAMSRIFCDDSLMSFVRRPAFSPCGHLLIVPAGCVEQHESAPTNATFIFSRDSLHRPCAVLPLTEKPSVAVSVCPTLFQLLPDCAKSFIGAAHRVVFAVITNDALLVYDTQQAEPIGYVSNIHYCPLTDVAWSADGTLVAVSSLDGYVSFVRFAPGELGEALLEPPTRPPPSVAPTPPVCAKTPKRRGRPPAAAAAAAAAAATTAKSPATPIDQFFKRTQRSVADPASRAKVGNDDDVVVLDENDATSPAQRALSAAASPSAETLTPIRCADATQPNRSGLMSKGPRRVQFSTLKPNDTPS